MLFCFRIFNLSFLWEKLARKKQNYAELPCTLSCVLWNMSTVELLTKDWKAKKKLAKNNFSTSSRTLTCSFCGQHAGHEFPEWLNQTVQGSGRCHSWSKQKWKWGKEVFIQNYWKRNWTKMNYPQCYTSSAVKTHKSQTLNPFFMYVDSIDWRVSVSTSALEMEMRSDQCVQVITRKQ